LGAIDARFVGVDGYIRSLSRDGKTTATPPKSNTFVGSEGVKALPNSKV